MNHVATVRYTDETGKRPFTDIYNLDLDQYMNMQIVSTHGLDDIFKEMKRLREMMEKWRSSSGRGLIAMTPEQGREENDRIRTAMEERRREADESDASGSGAE